jgi:hypothetical protein
MQGDDSKSGPSKDRECRFELHLHVECNSAGLPGRLEVRSVEAFGVWRLAFGSGDCPGRILNAAKPEDSPERLVWNQHEPQSRSSFYVWRRTMRLFIRGHHKSGGTMAAAVFGGSRIREQGKSPDCFMSEGKSGQSPLPMGDAPLIRGQQISGKHDLDTGVLQRGVQFSGRFRIGDQDLD